MKKNLYNRLFFIFLYTYQIFLGSDYEESCPLSFKFSVYLPQLMSNSIQACLVFVFDTNFLSMYLRSKVLPLFWSRAFPRTLQSVPWNVPKHFLFQVECVPCIPFCDSTAFQFFLMESYQHNLNSQTWYIGIQYYLWRYFQNVLHNPNF